MIRLLQPERSETQSLLTLLTPFLVFGALFVVLLLVWDR